MRAAIIPAFGRPPQVGEWPDPKPLPGQTLIRNRAAAVNPVDLKMASGTYYFGAPEPPYVAGAEGVGEANGVRYWYETGQRGGAFAELTAVDSDHLVALPDGLENAVAATLGVAGLAAWDALARRAALRKGETVLVLGASGAVGAFAVQIARLLGAWKVVAAARDTGTLSPSVRTAADTVVALDGDDLVARLGAAAPAGYDVIIDPLWGLPAQAALACTAENARLVQLGSAAGETVPIAGGIVRKSSTSILGYTIYAIPWEIKREAYRQLAAHAAAGRLVVEWESLPLAEIAEAWELQAHSPHRKLVLEM
ncbi:zinc-binding dehydrogenase [Fodinicola feengrottensis]|uniref:Zinc-binding dehydrogenase n=1 Tax=Fodinicola feengrottensis TaxID=435914 RepID=A0ABN2IQK4_9ACTN